MGWYLGGLLVSLCGLGLIDYRHGLALFTQPARTLATLAFSVAVFLVWDLMGIGLKVFFIGANSLLIGENLAPNLPVEEPVFLLLLCYTLLLVYLAVGRQITRRN